MNKAEIIRRLARAGVRDAADAFREEVRQRLASEAGGKTRNRQAVTTAAWMGMWDHFRPIVERIEQDKAAERPLIGSPEDPDEYLDPHYSETDPGRWLRDGLIWVAAEIRRVVIDAEDGTHIDLTRARTPPPTAWAVFCLESFARLRPAKRGELIGRVLPFAERSTTGITYGTTRDATGGYLDALE